MTAAKSSSSPSAMRSREATLYEQKQKKELKKVYKKMGLIFGVGKPLYLISPSSDFSFSCRDTFLIPLRAILPLCTVLIRKGWIDDFFFLYAIACGLDPRLLWAQLYAKLSVHLY